MSIDLNLQVEGIKDEYKYGFHDSDANYSFKSGKGLTRDIVEQISEMKNEPDWMRQLRLKALDVFWAKPLPMWGGELRELNFQDIKYFMRATDRQGRPGTTSPPRSRPRSTSSASPRPSGSSSPASARSTTRRSSTTASTRTSRRRA